MNLQFPGNRMKDYWNADEEKVRLGSPFMVDTYHLKQLAIYWNQGAADDEAVHDYFARSPICGSYLYVAGLERVLKYINNLSFNENEIAAFKAQYPKLASEDFIDYLRDFRFHGDIWAVPEGQIVFGQNEPIIKIKSNWLEGWYLETIIMSIMNGDISYATNATHFVSSARPLPVVDFGLRRAMGDGAKIAASRSVFVGGIAATSNVQATMNLGIPDSGTMSHEAIQYGLRKYGSEKNAFKEYIRAALLVGERLVLLVDTFHSVRGAQNAIDAMKELSSELGMKIKAEAFRIDSGDLYESAKKIRALDPKAEWFNGIFLTNDLGPDEISAIMEKDRLTRIITGFGAGTKLLNPPNVVGGVYKLSSIRIGHRWDPSMKICDSIEKVTLPGDKTVYRMLDSSGNFMKDLICLVSEDRPKGNCFEVLKQVVRNGKIVMRPVALADIQKFGRNNLDRLPDKYKQYNGKAVFPVEVSPALRAMQDNIMQEVLQTEEGCPIYA